MAQQFHIWFLFREVEGMSWFGSSRLPSGGQAPQRQRGIGLRFDLEHPPECGELGKP
ncbi:hypothetical protein [Variovorax saccharolyticus]|uniref:hypothetical protein n=1 Tax=Variovorax saccharolyticus TaxID=3053516 RepID=UPI002574CB37|nr:hypothetical protein [Variovorax sp. J22R187]MDM0018980.1 hypothetical protein [Variovorax sp. J22R187]